MPIFDDTRSDWNARPPLRPRTVVPWSQRIGVSWHWIGPGKGPSGTGSHQKCLDQVRDWQYQHQHKAPPDGPWKDIGYNALICQHARAIEGRGLEFAGSHSPGVNTEHVGVQFMVGDASGPPSAAMLARAVRLRADIGHLGKNIRRDWSHKDDPKAQTECAGPWITKWVHAGGPTNNQEDDGMSAAEVTEMKAYMRALLIDGYTVNGVDYPGIAKVDLENQKRITRTEAALTALAKGLGPQVEAAVRAALSAEYDARVELTPKAGN